MAASLARAGARRVGRPGPIFWCVRSWEIAARALVLASVVENAGERSRELISKLTQRAPLTGLLYQDFPDRCLRFRLSFANRRRGLARAVVEVAPGPVCG
jgi:hypothetical protein